MPFYHPSSQQSRLHTVIIIGIINIRILTVTIGIITIIVTRVTKIIISIAIIIVSTFLITIIFANQHHHDSQKPSPSSSSSSSSSSNTLPHTPTTNQMRYQWVCHYFNTAIAATITVTNYHCLHIQNILVF